MSDETLNLWRVFPWDRRALVGAAHSPSFVPPTTGRNRFDLPPDLSPVLYLAESPEHAIGEMLQTVQNQRVSSDVLRRAGLPLSLVSVSLPDGTRAELADLCDPETLAGENLRPDRLASRHRWVTQPLARNVWSRGFAGLRWWSSFWGDWHTVVLFVARVRGQMRFGEPSVLTPDSPHVIDASNLLGIRLV